MTQLWTVIRFELNSYFKNKGYILATVLLAAVLGVGLCIPRFFGDDDDKKKDGVATSEEQGKEKKDSLLIYDEAGIIKDTAYLDKQYPGWTWKIVSDEKKLEDEVKADTAEAGFVVRNASTYDYVVNNSKMYDSNTEMFDEILSYYNRANYMNQNKIDVEKMEEVLNTPIVSNQKVLGKDSVRSYAYTYILIFVIYFMIIFYGQMIAVSVTSEKSNRAIEVLITSSKPDYLIFGKVCAGAIASFLQIGIILGAGLVSYRANASVWSSKLTGMLGSIFDIPNSVLIVFAVFVVFGFLFYSFLYASLGALVSKTEDISKSVGPVMMVFIVGFMIAMFGLQEPDGMLIRITSFIPFTASYMMIIRTAMGTVTVLELIISALILVASCVLTGIIGAKVYRFGTLHYGNPLKLRNVLKRLISERE